MQTVKRAPNIAATAARRIIQPPIPYAYAFVLGSDPILPQPIAFGEEVVVVVADGRLAAGTADDWFAARVPTIPAVTGWMRVQGINQGNTIEVEVLGIDPLEESLDTVLLVTVSVAGDPFGRRRSTAKVPSGGIVQMPAQGPEAFVALGPVVVRRDHEGGQGWEPITAEATIRCTTTHGESA